MTEKPKTDENRRETVRGIGGVFLYAEDPAKLAGWYREHLGIVPEWEMPGNCGRSFLLRDEEYPDVKAMTVWAIMSSKQPMAPAPRPVVANYRVADLDRLLGQLRASGIDIEKQSDDEYGKFAWIYDPEGNRVELWQPPEA